MNIIAYTYEAGHHCIECTKNRYDSNEFDKAPSDYPYYIGDDTDDNEIGLDSLDFEGNYVHPLFDIDEWQEFDEWYLEENPVQHLTCGSCHEIIETFEHVV